MKYKAISQHDILGLVDCAEDYGHWNDVCLFSLYEWAKPVSDEDIQNHVNRVLENPAYTDEDEAEIITRLTKWRNKYEAAEKFRK